MSIGMETVMEEEEYNYREVRLPSLIAVVGEPELGRETGERRRGRDIIIAIDHGPNTKHAFDWALVHLCRLADTIHLVHAVSDLHNQVVYDITQGLMEKLAIEAFQVLMVKTVARIVEGDPGKVICKEAERIKPAAVVMGTRGRSLIQRFGSTIPLSETSSYHVTEASSCDFLQCATGKCW
uniref:UspA domain-containing protein n=1 Tax=Glycine max TaxID=3847 RepID=I1JSN5_SOYBN